MKTNNTTLFVLPKLALTLIVAAAALLAHTSFAAIAQDGTVSVNGGFANPQTLSYPTTAGSDLIVSAIGSSGGASCTYNGVSMTSLGVNSGANVTVYGTEMFFLGDVSGGTHNIVCSGYNIKIAAQAYSGADTATPTAYTHAGNATNVSHSETSPSATAWAVAVGGSEGQVSSFSNMTSLEQGDSNQHYMADSNGVTGSGTFTYTVNQSSSGHLSDVLVFLTEPSGGGGGGGGGGSSDDVSNAAQIFPIVTSSGQFQNTAQYYPNNGTTRYDRWWTYSGLYPDQQDLLSSNSWASEGTTGNFDTRNVTGGGFANGAIGSFWVHLQTSLDGSAVLKDYWFKFDVDETELATTFDSHSSGTKIIYLDPINDKVVATGTVSFTALVRILPSDFASSTYHLVVTYANKQFYDQDGVAVAFRAGYVHSFVFPVATTSGVSGFSATTSLSVSGKYYIFASLYQSSTTGTQNLRNALFNPQSLLGSESDSVDGVADTFNSTFVLATTTALDNYYQAVDDAIRGVTASTTVDFAACYPTSFGLVDCLTTLFGYQPAAMKLQVKSLHDNILVYAPFGYVTRLFDILALNTPVEPPPISYTFGSSSPVELQGQNITIQPWDHLDVLASIRADDGSNKNIFDIVDPWITLCVSLGVIFVILEDVLGMSFVSFGGGSSPESHRDSPSQIGGYPKSIHIEGQSRPVKVSDYSDYSQREWRNAKRNRLL